MENDSEKEPAPGKQANPDAPAFVTAAEKFGIGTDQGAIDPRLSQAPGLREVPNSRVPFGEHSHVMGPGQAAVDPYAAGLDVNAKPLSYAENRAVTTADGITKPAIPDAVAEQTPGPTGGATGEEPAPAQVDAAATKPGPVTLVDQDGPAPARPGLVDTAGQPLTSA